MEKSAIFENKEKDGSSKFYPKNDLLVFTVGKRLYISTNQGKGDGKTYIGSTEMNHAILDFELLDSELILNTHQSSSNDLNDIGIALCLDRGNPTTYLNLYSINVGDLDDSSSTPASFDLVLTTTIDDNMPNTVWRMKGLHNHLFIGSDDEITQFIFSADRGIEKLSIKTIPNKNKIFDAVYTIKNRVGGNLLELDQPSKVGYEKCDKVIVLIVPLSIKEKQELEIGENEFSNGKIMTMDISNKNGCQNLKKVYAITSTKDHGDIEFVRLSNDAQNIVFVMENGKYLDLIRFTNNTSESWISESKNLEYFRGSSNAFIHDIGFDKNNEFFLGSSSSTSVHLFAISEELSKDDTGYFGSVTRGLQYMISSRGEKSKFVFKIPTSASKPGCIHYLGYLENQKSSHFLLYTNYLEYGQISLSEGIAQLKEFFKLHNKYQKDLLFMSITSES